MCLNVGPASKTVGNIETELGECPGFVARENVWCADSVMTAILAGWRNSINTNGLRNHIKLRQNKF